MARYRDRGGFARASYTTADYLPSGTQQTISTVYPPRPGTGTRETITDYPAPGYFERRKQGVVELHPATLTRETVLCQPVTWSYGVNPLWGRRDFSGDVAAQVHIDLSVPVWVESDVVRAQNQVLIDAYARMNSPDAQLLVTAAEAEKTARMLRAPLESARSLATRVVGRKVALLRRGLSASQAAAQAWLEYRYGWKPLMYDIEGIVKAASRVRPDPTDLLVSRASTTIRWNSGVRTLSSSLGGVPSVTVDSEQSFKATVSAGVLYHITDSSYAAFKAGAAGLSLREVPSATWELVPFSFVVDWFVKVGPWLQASIPNGGVVVRGNWTTTKTDTYEKTDNIRGQISLPSNYPAPQTLNQSGGSYRKFCVTTDRKINQSLPSVPVVNPHGLSTFQTVDAAALILTRLAGSLNQLIH